MSEFEDAPGDDMWHTFCHCSPDVSLCGVAVGDDAEVEWESTQATECVVCADLEDRDCPRCGR